MLNEYEELYTIAIQKINAAWIKNPIDVHNRIDLLATKLGYKVIRIDSLSRLDSFTRDPPGRVIVVNCHGETLPMPTTWSTWSEYFTKVGENIRNTGWIFVSITGYPFYYYAQTDEKSESTWISEGSNGINQVLSVVGAKGWYFLGAPVMLTKEGENAQLHSGVSLPRTLHMSRCGICSLLPYKVFYEAVAPLYVGASAIQVGNGLLIQNGAMCVDFGQKLPTSQTDSILADMAIAFAHESAFQFKRLIAEMTKAPKKPPSYIA
jgi:hypothetical protein